MNGVMRTKTSVPLRQVSDLPGPRGWPLLGNLPQFDISSLHQQLESWAITHGSVYRLRFGTRDAVIVARPDLIVAIGRDRPDGWSRLRSMEKVMQEMGIGGLFAAEGDAWRRQRRLVADAFTPGQVKRYFPIIKLVTERLKQHLDQVAAEGAAIELQPLLMRYTVDVICSLTFGVDVDTLQRGSDELQEHIGKIFPKMAHRMNMPLPYWRWFTLPADHAFQRHLAAAQDAVSGFVKAGRERIAADSAHEHSPANLLDAMLAAHDADGASLTETELTGNVFTMLLAGEDTTANSLAWSLYLLRTHPEAWQAVVTEVDAEIGPNRIPATPEAASGLASIENAVNEAMRLYPVAPLAYFETNHPTEIAGVALPAGTFVICLRRCGAVDPATAADAAVFRPARWQAPDDAPDRNLTAASMPFGSGPRICPGRYLAMLEMKMVLATIARNYELVEVATVTGAPPKETFAFAMYPAGLRLRIKPREPASLRDGP